MGKPIVLVEHMEEYPTRWLIAEYTEARDAVESLGGSLVVTGARDGVLQALLDREGVPWRWEHAWELCDRPGTIVLDLWAERDLEPWEAQAADCFVVGGIMGDYPPRGRGKLLAWMFDWSSARRLGSAQMSIHVAAWAAMMVRRGVRVNELPLVEGATVRVRGALGVIEIELPYAYPRGPGGEALVPERIRRVLEKGVVYDEETLLF